jgi:hypothetical protein
MIVIGDAAIHRAYGSTLRFFVKTFAFGALIGYYIIKFVRNRFIFHISVHIPAIGGSRCAI